MILALLAIPAMVVLDSCSSGKAAYEQGNYYESVMTSVSRLRRNTDHKKSVETLRQAYPLAVRYYEDQANNVLASNNEFKWTSVVQSYTMINMMYDEIKRSPGAMAVIPNPVNYHNKLDEAKRNAAEENYQAGILALSVGSRDKAKQAYGLFKRANDFVVGYKEVNNYMEQALFAATVKVLITPVPATRNVAWSAEFFNDKISEFLHTASINEFVRFYTLSEAQTLKLNPDHVIELTFDEFMVGQVTMHEKQIQLEKDSVVMGTYIAPSTQVAANTNTTSNIQNQNNTGSNSNTGNPTSGNTSSNVLPNTGTTQNNTVNTNLNNQSNTGTGNLNNQAQNSQSNNTQNAQPNHNNQGGSGNQNQQNNNNQNSQEANEDKVTICHKPPGNTANTQTLIIPMSAVQAHLDHGDALGFCDDSKGNSNKPAGNKNNNSKGASGAGYGSLIQKNHDQLLLASNETKAWMFGITDEPPTSDTVTIYGKVKATYYHYQKTTTSKGIVSFRIIDAKTKGILSAEKMPGQYVWISEWATFNGDERALTPLQLEIAKQRERVPPPAQDLFIEFTKPIYTQITGKIQNFYKGY
jgi:hypothetical protein